jgi:hypothetical protein
MNYSDALSIVALIISGISLIISWRTFTRDRSQIKIAANLELQEFGETSIIIEIVNVGRRITILKELSIILTNKPGIYRTLENKEMKEAESYKIEMTRAHLGTKIANTQEIKYIEIEETNGILHKIRGKDVVLYDYRRNKS